MKFLNISKKIFLFLITILFVTCKKDGNAGQNNYYVKFKLDGSLRSYSDITQVAFINNNMINEIGFIAQRKLSDTAYEKVLVVANSYEAIVENRIYTDSILRMSTREGVINFTEPNGTIWTSITDSGKNVKIIFTKIGDKEISGTFSGKIYNPSDILVGEQSITEGEFTVAKPE